MEGGSEVEKKKPPEGDIKSKRKMKTASQLEILEKTYAVHSYPSEELRAELSGQLGLSDRQLQMWFCHRRLKDRKPPPVKRQPKDSPSAVSVPAGDKELAGTDSSPFGRVGVAVQRIGGHVAPMTRYYEMPTPQQSMKELRVIAFVEAQLGEPLREDGPILGMEFDPLPPDAFGAPIGGQLKYPGHPFESNQYDRPDGKPVKDMFTVHPQGSTRTLHEYQFLPEQPTVRTDTYERAAPTYHYGSPVDSSNSRNPSLSTGRSFMHENEQVSSGYAFPGQLPSLNLLSQQGRQNHLLPSASEEYENVPRKNSFINTALDPHLGTHAITALENQFVTSDRRVTLDEDASRMEKKRKSEEARIAREVEAHAKRIRKELEKQDILRRKREEQIRKEMERQDREKRKEEERLLREKQREEERYLREQRRELERREKFLQKESIRAEKMRQKEELRREKEAARLRAANERAIARKIAKDSMELIEDERLELMELAVSSKGLPSILSLDFETLQNLESFRDVLCPFPPKSVKLRRPFAILPWNGSEENVGNLLMVWRFLITFADILGLWPFTLDEFVQAFHDYEPRLLGEIHIALLRSIIKDIEDAMKTPVTGLGANQSSVANPGGGHPQIVEGAYSWGFDIHSWQHHLNALTWPEVLRQFALSAGFGPQPKKRNIEQTCLHDDDEGNDGGDIISNLRNGVAAENAVAIMQERGFSNSRRSRHRLTPGTVKFAAFHVLSLEGSKGLTILEVADKIQKSGLRDLTTSKTPEASISAALSRDSKLFERTAPSTYCLRAAYRKDPVNSEAILSAARERVRIFTSGFIDGEEADEAERDEGFESDVAEDPELDDLGTELNLKEKHNSQEAKSFTKTLLGNRSESNEVTEIPLGGLGTSGEGLSSKSSECFNEIKGSDGLLCQANTDIDESNPGDPWAQGLMEGEYSDLSVEERLNALVALIGVAIEGNSLRIVLEERLEAANSLKKLMWAEAQLDKRRIKEDYVSKMNFSAYMGKKTEPNLANSLVEGRRSPFVIIDDKNDETSVDLIIKQERLSDQQNDDDGKMPPEGNLQMQDYTIGVDNLQYQQAGYAAEKSRSQLKSDIGRRAEEMYVYRSLPLGQDRRRNRYWRFITSVSQNDPGCGRIFVELHDGRWRLIDSEEGFDALLASLDLRGVRESHLHSMLQKIEMPFKDTVRRSMVDMNTQRKNQETAKPKSFEAVPWLDYNIDMDSPGSTLCVSDSDMSETSTTFSIGLGRNVTERNDALKRYEDYEKWMWNECANSLVLHAMKYGKKRCKQVMSVCDYCHDVYLFEGNHCPSCHGTFNTFNENYNFSEHVAQCEEKLKIDHDCTFNVSPPPLRLRLLKLLLSFVEVCIPREALQPDWTDGRRKLWGTNLYSSLSAAELLQGLTQLESAIKRDYLSTDFETTSELLNSTNALTACTPNGFTSPERVCILPWVPHTTAAVVLRLMEFDASVSYLPHQKVEPLKDKKEGVLMKFPSRYGGVKNSRADEAIETPYQTSYSQEGNWMDVGIGLDGQNRGRTNRGRIRGCTRGGRSHKRVAGSRSESGKKNINSRNDRFGRVLVWKEQPRGRGRKLGRCSARSREKAGKVVGVVGERDIRNGNMFEKSRNLRGDEGSKFENSRNLTRDEGNMFEKSRNLMRDEWNGDKMTKLQEGDENDSRSESSEYDNENGQATEDEYDDMLDTYGCNFAGRPNELQEVSDGNEEGEDDGEGDLDVEEYIKESLDEEEGMRVIDEDRNVDPEQGIGSTSTDFSD